MVLGRKILGKNPFEAHLLNYRQRKGGKRKLVIATLMLTSMVDMFSMLVVFLLQTFSSSPEILVTKGVTLPEAISVAMIQEAPVVSLTSEKELYLDKILVGNLESILKKPTLLSSKLNLLKSQWMKQYPDQAFPGKVNFQASKEIKSTKISEILSILTAGQFETIDLSVVQGN